MPKLNTFSLYLAKIDATKFDDLLTENARDMVTNGPAKISTSEKFADGAAQAESRSALDEGALIGGRLIFGSHFPVPGRSKGRARVPGHRFAPQLAPDKKAIASVRRLSCLGRRFVRLMVSSCRRARDTLIRGRRHPITDLGCLSPLIARAS
jgi:hypothetical protein